MTGEIHRFMPFRLLFLALFAMSLLVLWRTGSTGIDDTPRENRLPALLPHEAHQLMQDSVFRAINHDYQVIRPILASRCFDCHSQFTEYPWYHKLPIVKSMIDSHIRQARESLDLSADFPFSGKEPVLRLLEEMREEVEEGKMPPQSYRLLHWGRLIDGTTRDSLFNWIDAARAIIEEFHKEHGHLLAAGQPGARH